MARAFCWVIKFLRSVFGPKQTSIRLDAPRRSTWARIVSRPTAVDRRKVGRSTRRGALGRRNALTPPRAANTLELDRSARIPARRPVHDVHPIARPGQWRRPDPGDGSDRGGCDGSLGGAWPSLG